METSGEPTYELRVVNPARKIGDPGRDLHLSSHGDAWQAVRELNRLRRGGASKLLDRLGLRPTSLGLFVEAVEHDPLANGLDVVDSWHVTAPQR